MLIRCSSLHKIMGDPKGSPTPRLSDTAKSHIREVAKQDLFGFVGFDGNKYTHKGNLLEDLAIEYSGLIRAKKYKKNEVRINNDWLTGECDILDEKRSLIIDTKNSWDIGTHPFFAEEAKVKATKAGYQWQMQGYMFLYDIERADIDFWLFPTPEEAMTQFSDAYKLVELVEQIPVANRGTTVTISRDEKAIEKIKIKCELAQEYYQSLINERKWH